MANRPRSIWARAAGIGLTAGSGGGQDLDLSELDAKTAPVMADSVALVDSSDDSTKIATLANCLKILGETAAGTNATSGLSETDGVMKVNVGGTTASTEPTTASKIMVEVGGVNKSATLANVAKAIGETMAGTVGTSGVSEVDGVLTAAIKLAHLVADEKSALFFEALEVDFGVATAVDAKITDAITAKGKLISVQAVITEAFTGDASSVIQLSKAAAGDTAMCSAITVVVGECPNKLGGVFGVIPNADGSEVVASGGDVYAYSAAVNNRTAGKVRFVCMFQKTA